MSSQYELADTLRRIRNIAAVCPPEGWTLTEAKAVLAVLSGIVRTRQGFGDVGLRVDVSLRKPSGQLADQLVVWEVPGRSDHLDNAGDLGRFEVPSSDERFDRRLA